MSQSPELRDLLKVLSRLEPEAGFVYFIGEMPDGPIKIGIGIDPEARLETLQTGNPRSLVLLGGMPGGINAERILHARFMAQRLRGEWFERSPLLDDLILYWHGFNIHPRSSECCDVLVVRGRCSRCGDRAA